MTAEGLAGAPPAGPSLSPERILELGPEDADALLDRLEREIPVLPSTLLDVPAAPNREAIVFGDTHGDWRSTVAAAARFLDDPHGRILVGLGDYVDRAPDDCGAGSVANALYLLGLAANYPGRVVLIQGNHETTRRIPVVPQNLPEEVDELWGPDVTRYSRLLALLERGPLGALTSNGVYFAHGGFPRRANPGDLRESFRSPTEETLLDLVWGECGAARSYRGFSTPFGRDDLARFLSGIGATVFVRGHDPDLAGRSVFDDRCLTLHTSRVYERYGGVLIARIPLDRPVLSTRDLQLEHLETEGQEYPEPW